MSKGKDFRGPRKRGFDDDGPSPYDNPRQVRPTRPAFDRPPMGGGFGDFGAAPQASFGAANAIDAVVKWFDGAKGFGFVQANDGGKDVFVHISILGQAGISQLPEGQAVTMKVVDTQKGREAVAISLA